MKRRIRITLKKQATLHERMAQGQKDVALSDIMPRYQQLAQEYCDNDAYNLSAEDVYPGTVAEAATAALAHVSEHPNETGSHDELLLKK